MRLNPTSTRHFKQPPDKFPDGAAEKGPASSPLEGDEAGAFLLCSNCLHLITFHRAAVSINGAHEHTFANPSGLVYTIGCFNQAPGTAAMGAATAEFSWFQGYRWRVAVCAACLSHLGWRFTSGTASFFGLIRAKLVDSDQGPGRA